MAAKAVPKECSAVSAEPRKARQTAKRAGTARKKKAEEMGFGAVFLGLNMQIINYFDCDDKTSIILQLEKLQGGVAGDWLFAFDFEGSRVYRRKIKCR